MRLIPYIFLMLILPLSGTQQAYGNESGENMCVVSTDTSGKLFQARELFESQCSTHTLVDCDPIKGGGWQCASAIIGLNAPRMAATPTVTQTADADGNNQADDGLGSDNDLSNTDSSASDSESNQPAQCYAVATGLFQSKVAFAQQCAAYQRQDCDPLGNNRWVCSSAKILNANGLGIDEQLTVVDSTVTTDSNSPTENTSNNTTSQNNNVDNTSQTNPTVGRLKTNDLLALHYDNCPDKDDGHAIPAGKSIVEKFGINNVMVVNGTCGDSIKNRFNPDSNAVVQASWGSEYLDAHGNNNNAVWDATNRWASTLSNGAEVWVAEGGQSDFTADVVRRIEANYSGINLKNIHVIQHSAGATAYNEAFTNPNNLSYLKNKTSYQAIPTGNAGNNGSADLNEQSQYFVVTARASRFSVEWNAGFNYLKPDCAIRTENCKLDFSDTVELLYIVNDQQTKTVNDFANTYLK